MTRRLDLEGKTFGSRTVVRRLENSKHGSARWLVRCSCGKENVMSSQAVRDTKQCRACANAVSKRLENLTGETFGSWTVLQRNSSREGTVWHTLCSCGRRGNVSTQALKSGKSKSCKSCGSTKYQNAIDLTNEDWCWLLGVFHGDGNTYFAQDGGGTVTFACKPRQNQTKIVNALDRLEVPHGLTVNGVHVYSVVLAKDFSRFKVSGRGKEKWMFPEEPKHFWAWVSGLLDSDGCVSADGKGITFYQKPHGGLDTLRDVLKSEDIEFSTYSSSTRPMEQLRILAKSRTKFLGLVHPRYPKKSCTGCLGEKTYTGEYAMSYVMDVLDMCRSMVDSGAENPYHGFDFNHEFDEAKEAEQHFTEGRWPESAPHHTNTHGAWSSRYRAQVSEWKLIQFARSEEGRSLCIDDPLSPEEIKAIEEAR